MLVKVSALSRYYGAHCALSDVSFEVECTGVVGLLGQNGAGKSTVMQIISGVLAPSSGRVEIAGFDIQTNAQQAKQQIGYLPEVPPLYTDLTVDEYLYFAARLRGVQNRKLTAAVANSKNICNLDQHGKHLIGHLSNGFKQRVGIAQAIIHSPPFIILDEPTAGLDPLQIVEIRKLISSLGKTHSIILSSHILSEIQSMCQRIIILQHGKLIIDEQLSSLHDNEKKQLLVQFMRPPALSTLTGIDGVISVHKVDAKQFIIEHASAPDPTQKLVEVAVTQGLDLCQLTPLHNTLEQLFTESIYHDNQHAKLPRKIIP